MSSERTAGAPRRSWGLLAIVAATAFAAGGGAVALFTADGGAESSSSGGSADPVALVSTAQMVRITGPDGRSVDVEARIDTGAEGSSMDDDIARELGFDLENADTIKVSSSLGTERRPVVEGRIRLGDLEKDVRLSVTDRDEREFAVLLGRRDLAGVHVVIGEEED